MSAKRELLARRESLKNPACPHSIVEAVLHLHPTRASRSRRFRLDCQNIREKLLEFGKLVISTATAQVETAIKFYVVKVKLAGFQW